MKRILAALILSFGFTSAATSAPFANGADAVTAGRAALVAKDLTTAQADFAAALAFHDASSQTASALLGITRFFAISGDAGSTTFLNGLNVPSPGRDIYNWTAQPPTDGNGAPMIPPNYNLTSVEAFWQSALLNPSTGFPAVRGSLALVTDPAFLLTLYSSETTMPTSVNIDYGDVLMARASLSAAEFVFHFLSGQDLHANLDAVNQLAQGNMLTLQKVLAGNPNLFSVGSADERAAAKDSLSNVIALYRQASTFIRARTPGVSRLFMLDPLDLTAEADFRASLDKLELSLKEAVAVDEGRKAIFLGPLFDPSWSMRDRFPVFNSSTGGFDLESITDPSLGGVMAGLTREDVARAFEHPELGWTWVSPIPQGSALYRYLALSGGNHVASGDAGTVLTSTNGTTWNLHSMPHEGGVWGLATNSDSTAVVAVTDQGSIYLSTDAGLTWQRKVAADSPFYAVTFGGGKFVAVGDYGQTAVSSDGQQWTVDSPPTGGNSLYDVLYTGSTYLAVGQFNGRAVIASSADGSSWSTIFTTVSSSPAFYGVAQGGGKFVAVGMSNQGAVSANGTSWNEGAMLSAGTANFNGVGYFNGVFVAAGNDVSGSSLVPIVATSSSGASSSWASLASGETTPLNTVGVGASGAYITGGAGLILKWDSSATFTRALSPQTIGPLGGGLLSIRALGTELYAVGGSSTVGTIVHSSDGVSFSAVIASGATSTLWGILQQGSNYYAVGNGGTLVTTTTPTGTWTAAAPHPAGTNANLRSISYLNNSLFVITGNNATLITSSDGGSTWNARTTLASHNGNDVLYSAAYGNSVYVAVGGNNNNFNYVFTSPDGTTWTQRNLGIFNTFRALVFHQGYFTAVGSNGAICRSANGVNWSWVDSGTRADFGGLSVRDGRYYALAGTSASTPGPSSFPAETQSSVLVSSDGLHWVKTERGTTNNAYALELFNGRLYTSGDNVSIMRSESIPATSAPVLTVLAPSNVVRQGDNLTIAVATNGDGGENYAWSKGGVPIVGATGVTLQLNNVQFGNAGTYVLTATNAAGSTDSSPIIVTVEPGTITPQPMARDRFNPNANGSILSTVVQPDGRIVISGNFTTLQPFDAASMVTRTRIARLNRDGTVDGTFLSTASLDSGATAMVLQPDGRILVAGWFTTVNGVTRNHLARLNADGSLDTGFDPNPSSIVNALVVRPDGKIVIGGSFYNLQPNGAASPTARPYLARINSDGTLDTGFNVAFDPGEGSPVTALALQREGSLLIGGYFTTVAGSPRSNLARLKPDDTLDAAFDPGVDSGQISRIVPLRDGRILLAGSFYNVGGQSRNGVAIVSGAGVVDNFQVYFGGEGAVYDVAVQPDGKILLAGSFGSVNCNYDSNLARLLPGGSVDTDFSAYADNSVRQLAVQSDGSIIVVGDFTSIGCYNRNYIARVLPDGSVERSLVADTELGCEVETAVLQPDGKMIVGGTFNEIAGGWRDNLARLNADSTLDGFDAYPNGAVHALAVQPDGRILVGGEFTDIDYYSRRGFARLENDGSLDGAIDLNLNGDVNALALQSDGKFLLGGSFTSVRPSGDEGPTVRHYVARFDAAGALDTVFNPNPDGEITALALQPDGKILLGGSFANVGATPVARARLARLNADGTLDTFNPGANDIIDAIVVQPDGKILLGGLFTQVAGATRNHLARLNADGTLDTFNPGADGPINSLSLQADGKIVVGGSFTTVAGTTRSFLARLNADGTPDNSYQPYAAGVINTTVLRPDGKTVLGGAFDSIGGQPRVSLARLTSTGPTSSMLTVDGLGSTITWQRNGPLPLLAWATFEFSLDGSSWDSLGTGVRAAGTGYWQLSGLSLPADKQFYLRARAAAPSSVHASSSLVEQVQQVYLASLPAPPLTSVPAATAGGITAVVGGSVTLTVTPAGSGPFTYEWRKFGQPILGQNGATLTLTNLSLFDAGIYDVKVVNNGTPLFAAAARVVVDPAQNVPAQNFPDVLTASAAFVPLFEVDGGYVDTMKRGSDGKVYLAGDFTSFNAAPRPGLARLNSDGSLDSGFTPVPANGQVRVFAVQGGKVVIAGDFTSVGGYERRRIARLNGDGSLDLSFKSAYALQQDDSIRALAVQGDGKVVAAGSFYGGANIFRLNVDGSIDTSFNVGGGFNGPVIALALQPNGYVVVGGTFSAFDAASEGGGTAVGRIARLDINGSLDNTFISGTGFDNGEVDSLALQVESNQVVGVIAAGSFTSYNDSGCNFIARLGGADAKLDTSFNASNTFNLQRANVELEADGTLLVVGYDNNAEQSRITRLLSTGETDPSFSGSAAFDSNVDGAVQLTVTGTPVLVALRNKGDYGEDSVGPFVRLSNTAGLDPTYNPFMGRAGDVYAIAPAPDGKWVVGGSFQYVNGVARGNLARLKPDGSLDDTFMSTGSGFDNDVDAVIVQPDGKVIAGGRFTSFNADGEGGDSVGYIARLNDDGTFDTTFNQGTYNGETVMGGGFNNDVNALAFAPDGKIYATGSFDSYDSYNRGSDDRQLLMRLNTDGTFDDSFDQPNWAFGDSSVHGNTLLVAPNGDVYVGGSNDYSSSDGLGYYYDDSRNVSELRVGGLVRFKPDGALDTGFNDGSYFEGGVSSLALQPDGKLVVGGDFSWFYDHHNDGNGEFQTGNVARLNSDGSLDAPQYDSGNNLVAGFAPTEFVSGSESGVRISSLLLQPDGKIIAGGDFLDYGSSSPTAGVASVARLNANGTIDRSFRVPSFYQPVDTMQFAGPDTLLIGGAEMQFPSRISAGLALLEGVTLPTLTSVSPGIGKAGDTVTINGTFLTGVGEVQFNGVNAASFTVVSPTQINAVLPPTVTSGAVSLATPFGVIGNSSAVLGVFSRDLVNLMSQVDVPVGGSVGASFTIEGTAAKQILIRGVGPTLALLEESSPVLADPEIKLFNGTSQIGSNNDWGTNVNVAAISATIAQVGATPFAETDTKSAALLVTLNPGTYTVRLDGLPVDGADSTGGKALLEIYDADTGASGNPHLVMLTTRAPVSSKNYLTAGFTVSGTAPKQFLIRALGESLGGSYEFATDVLPDPEINVYQGETTIAHNDDWHFQDGDASSETGDGPIAQSIIAAAAAVGARPLDDSLDSAVLVTLEPGVYTVQVNPCCESPDGEGMLEIFEVDASRSATFAPVITYTPNNHWAEPGSEVTFGVDVVAKPSAAVTYQWRKGGLPLTNGTTAAGTSVAGATSPVLTLSNVQAADTANYDVVVSNGVGAPVASAVRTLTVLVDYHSADTDHDHSISLLELTRVIQLYNTKVGATRTGDYHTQAGTEDGYAPGAGAITVFHSADTNHDGRIDAFELSRVIELYNFVDGTVRLGRYYKMSGTEDGFTPGYDPMD